MPMFLIQPSDQCVYPVDQIDMFATPTDTPGLWSTNQSGPFFLFHDQLLSGPHYVEASSLNEVELHTRYQINEPTSHV